MISVSTLSQTGQTQTSTAPPVVYHWANQLMFDVYWSQNWTSAEKIGAEAMSCVGHFVFTLGQWNAILPYQMPWLLSLGLTESDLLLSRFGGNPVQRNLFLPPNLPIKSLCIHLGLITLVHKCNYTIHV